MLRWLTTSHAAFSLFFRFDEMPSVRSAVALALMLFVLVEWSRAMPTDKDKERLLNAVDVSTKGGRRRSFFYSTLLLLIPFAQHAAPISLGYLFY